ncbi:MAG: GNAT family N-acetyltransferase [Polyangiaceae bacterium]
MTVTLRTPHLDVFPITKAHLRIEIFEPSRLGETLGVEVPEGWPPGLYDRDAAEFFLAQAEMLGPAADGWFGWYGVLRDGERRVLVASAGYFGPPDATGIIEIGYSVVESYRGRGIATEMVNALVARAVGTAGVTRVVAEAHETNIGSHKVLERAGFVKIGPGREPDHVRFRYEGPA